MSNQPVEIDAIRARANKATKGPWFHNRTSGREVRHVDPSGDECFVCKPFTNNVDSEFIAHSRQDIPALCDEVEALRARVKELEANGQLCNWSEDENGNWETDCGNCFVLEAETPSSNEMKFCAYCGKELTETRYTYDDEPV